MQSAENGFKKNHLIPLKKTSTLKVPVLLKQYKSPTGPNEFTYKHRW